MERVNRHVHRGTRIQRQRATGYAKRKPVLNVLLGRSLWFRYNLWVAEKFPTVKAAIQLRAKRCVQCCISELAMCMVSSNLRVRKCHRSKTGHSILPGRYAEARESIPLLGMAIRLSLEVAVLGWVPSRQICSSESSVLADTTATRYERKSAPV